MKLLRIIQAPIIFLLCLAWTAQAQIEVVEKKIRSQKLEFEHQDKSYVLDLKYNRHSDVSFYLYTAQGNLIEKKSKKNWPIAAFFSPEKVSVYYFESAEDKEDLLRLEGACMNPPECTELFHNIVRYDKKWVLEDSQGIWIEDGDSSSFTLQSEAPNVYQNLEFLQFRGNQLALDQFRPLHNFEFVTQAENRVVLSYRYTSNPYNPMGRCGAGEEAGLLLLHLNQSEIDSSQNFTLESCYFDRYFDREEKTYQGKSYLLYQIDGNSGRRNLFFNPDNAKIARRVEDIF